MRARIPSSSRWCRLACFGMPRFTDSSRRPLSISMTDRVPRRRTSWRGDGDQVIGLDASILARAGEPKPASGRLVCCQPPLARQHEPRMCSTPSRCSLSPLTVRRPALGSRRQTPPLRVPAVPASRPPWPPCAPSRPTPVPMSTSATISNRTGRRPSYSRLLEIKQRYDPDGLFVVHHGVGSEVWSPDGFTKRP
jgi:hypothetical protein